MNNTEPFFIGQRFYKTYPRELAVWCNKNNAKITRVSDDLVIVEPKTEHVFAYTNEELKEMRKQAYQKEIDGLHSEKLRKTVLNEWTEEDEAEYVQQVIELSNKIHEMYPYHQTNK